MSVSAFIDGVGVLGPGLTAWPAVRALLTGAQAYTAAATVLPTPSILPPAERRRTGRVIKLAIAVALEATQHAQAEPAALASVFTSSGGDGHNCHEICEVLASQERAISPTRFANSVHNAAAGYWSIATSAKSAANVLCAYDASFGAGLLEAITQVVVEGESVLLVSYDTEYPQPLHAKRPLPDAFGTALVLSPTQSVRSLARVSVELTQTPVNTLEDPALEALRTAIPAARCLPLLRLLARSESGVTVLDYLDVARLRVSVDACA